MLGGGCTFASYSLALWAMTQAPIAPVAALRETSIVFSAVLALFVLKEHISTLRYMSIAIVTAGAVVIKIF
jgi:drug/metabolite transporter (DMT)-like permease